VLSCMTPICRPLLWGPCVQPCIRLSRVPHKEAMRKRKRSTSGLPPFLSTPPPTFGEKEPSLPTPHTPFPPKVRPPPPPRLTLPHTPRQPSPFPPQSPLNILATDPRHRHGSPVSSCGYEIRRLEQSSCLVFFNTSPFFYPTFLARRRACSISHLMVLLLSFPAFSFSFLAPTAPFPFF